MADTDQVSLLLEGEEAWNEWRRRTRVKPRLAGADLERANLTNCDPNGADMQGARLAGASLTGTFLAWVQLNGADLKGARASTVYMDHADLSDADLTDAKLLDARLTDANLRRATLINTDLKGADLGRADLRDVSARHADLTGALMVGANLGRAKLQACQLGESDLTGASMEGARLVQVELQAALLIEADLTRATMTGTNLRRVDLREAKMSGTVLESACLAGARSLSTVRHLRQSVIDQATLAQAGELPADFLRGFSLPGPEPRPAGDLGESGGGDVQPEIMELRSRVRKLSDVVAPGVRQSLEECLRLAERAQIDEARAQLYEATHDLLRVVFSGLGKQAILDVPRGIARLESLHSLGRIQLPERVRRALGSVAKTGSAEVGTAFLRDAVRGYMVVLEWVYCSYDRGPRCATVYQA